MDVRCTVLIATVQQLYYLGEKEMLMNKLMNTVVGTKLNDSLFSNDCEADDLIEYVKNLMHWYSHQPSEYLAHNIVSNLEIIKIKIEQNECSSLDCECERLLKKWRYQVEFRRSNSAAKRLN